MKLLIGTPAFGGKVFTEYLTSMIGTQHGFHRDGIEFSVCTIDNESFINRARDRIANIAMAGDYDKLIFIDADMGWTYNDMCNLCNSDKNIVGGTYPIKDLPISLNFNPLDQHFHYFENLKRTVEDFDKFKNDEAVINGEIEVMHVPTGFMSINTAVLHHLHDKTETYTLNGKTLNNFFPHSIKNGILESEDWAFCSLARENGIPVYLNTKIVLSHTGTYKYEYVITD